MIHLSDEAIEWLARPERQPVAVKLRRIRHVNNFNIQGEGGSGNDKKQVS